MLKYVRGYFKHIIPYQYTLIIELTDCTHNCDKCKNPSRKTEDGQLLNKEIIDIALSSFKRYIESICFVGGENHQAELKELCKHVHTHKLDTCLVTQQQDFSTINKNLIDELDYIIVGRCDEEGTLLKKDYCSFAETYDWLEVNN